MNSLGAALQGFGDPEVPGSEELRQLIMNCVTAANGGDENDYRVAEIIEGLLESYLAACAMEDDEDEDELNTLDFAEAERLFLASYATAYAQSTGQRPEQVESGGWPEFLPESGRYTRELVIDLGRLVGFLDVQRFRALQSFFIDEERRKARMQQLSAE
jgi:hypothetical protein